MGVEIVRLGCKKLVSKKMDWRAFAIWALLLVIAQGRQINADEGGYYDSDIDRPDNTEEFPAVHQTVHQQFPGHHNHLGALGARSLKKANGGKRGNGKAKKDSEACSCTDLWWNYPASNCCRDKSFMESKKKKVGCEKIKVSCKKVRYYDLSLCCPKPKVIEMNEMTHTTKNTPGHHNNLGALGVRSLKKANGGQGTGIAHDPVSVANQEQEIQRGLDNYLAGLEKRISISGRPRFDKRSTDEEEQAVSLGSLVTALRGLDTLKRTDAH